MQRLAPLPEFHQRFSDYVTSAEIGMTDAEVFRLYPRAQRFFGFNGQVCWRTEELVPDSRLK
jgi:hypothetical protein